MSTVNPSWCFNSEGAQYHLDSEAVILHEDFTYYIHTKLEHRKQIFTALTTHTCNYSEKIIVIYLASLLLNFCFHATLSLNERRCYFLKFNTVEKLNVLVECHICLFYTLIYKKTKTYNKRYKTENSKENCIHSIYTALKICKVKLLGWLF